MIASILKESPDSLSSTRFAFLLAVIISNFAIFGIWVGLSIYSGAVLEIPESVLILYCLSNGLSFSGKIFAKYLEGKKTDQTEQNKNSQVDK
jgi:hypothetical protein